MQQSRINDHINFRKLDETFVMLLGHVDGHAYFINKITNEKFGLYAFEVEPTCGLIGTNNDWALVGGEVLVLKTLFDNSVRMLPLASISALKKIGDYSAQIHIDPRSENASAWLLEVDVTNPAKPVRLRRVE